MSGGGLPIFHHLWTLTLPIYFRVWINLQWWGGFLKEKLGGGEEDTRHSCPITLSSTH